MKNSIMCTLIATLIAGHSHAVEVTTRDNYMACHREDHLDDILRFIEAQDARNIRMYFATQKCDLLRKGLRASVTRVGSKTIAIDINGTEPTAMSAL